MTKEIICIQSDISSIYGLRTHIEGHARESGLQVIPLVKSQDSAIPDGRKLYLLAFRKDELVVDEWEFGDDNLLGKHSSTLTVPFKGNEIDLSQIEIENPTDFIKEVFNI